MLGGPLTDRTLQSEAIKSESLKVGRLKAGRQQQHTKKTDGELLRAGRAPQRLVTGLVMSMSASCSVIVGHDRRLSRPFTLLVPEMATTTAEKKKKNPASFLPSATGDYSGAAIAVQSANKSARYSNVNNDILGNRLKTFNKIFKCPHLEFVAALPSLLLKTVVSHGKSE